MRASNYILRCGTFLGSGSLKDKEQWQPTTYGTGASHDPSPPIIIEDAPALIVSLILRMLLGMGM